MALLQIKNLNVSFLINGESLPVISGVNLNIGENETLVLAGESGSGKTITSLSITKLLPKNSVVTSGEVHFLGTDLLQLKESELSRVRGAEIAYVFQEPTSFLNPIFTIGNQLMEVIILHQGVDRDAAYSIAVELLRQTKLSSPERLMHSYPHQLSGGMNQRVFLAMSLACRPRLLIADEPTTALDVTVEAEILRLLKEFKEKLGFALLFITHNLSLARKIADRICIMYQGRIVEEAGVNDIFTAPRHPHTQKLLWAYEKIGRL